MTIGGILYDHIGLGMFSKVDLPPDVVLDRNFYPDGTKPNGDYGGFDRFGRIRRQMWVDGDFTTGTGDNPNRPPLVDIALVYDEASNRLEALNENDVLSQWVIRDYHYTYDGLDRLDVAQRGQDTGPGFTYAPFDAAYMPSEGWTLDAVGDWSFHQTDRDQSGDFDFDDDSDDRTHNIRHEILTRGILINEDPFNPVQYVLDHDTDLAGNMIFQEVADGAPFKPKLVYTQDAWNRLVKVEFVDETPQTFDRAEYEYTGLNWRTLKRADTNADGVLDEQQFLYYNGNWQLIEERIDDDAPFETDPLDTSDIDRHVQYIWGPQYIDDCIEHRENNDFTNDSPRITFEETYYHLCDAQFSPVAIIDGGANIKERISYTPCGEARNHSPGDLDGDGDRDTADIDLLNANWGNWGMGNLNRDGTVGVSDLLM